MLEHLVADAKERALHVGSIHELARDSGAPEQDVERIYTRELTRLKRGARVADFLPVLVTRAVKETLRVRRHAQADGALQQRADQGQGRALDRLLDDEAEQDLTDRAARA
jgi:hypothetical protein